MNDKKQQLLKASIELFAAEGFWNTPTAKIARHAGVATGTLFNYFPSKDALINAVYVELKHEWREHVLAGYPEEADVKSRLEHIWFRNIDWGVNHFDHYSLTEQLRMADVLSDETIRHQNEELTFLYKVVCDGFDQAIFKEMDIDYFNRIVLAELDATVRYAVAFEIKDMALTKLIMTSIDILWNGIAR